MDEPVCVCVRVARWVNLSLPSAVVGSGSAACALRVAALGGKQNRKMAQALGMRAAKGLKRAETKIAEARTEVANRKLELDTDLMIAGIFDRFDADNDTALSSNEYKQFLVAIDSWGKHKYTDADWAGWWPEEAKNLGTEDHTRGVPLASFTLLYTKFRTTEMLATDYVAIFPESAGNLPRRAPTAAAASSSPTAARAHARTNPLAATS